MDLLVRDCNVYEAIVPRGYLTHQDILIKGNIIESVCPSAELNILDPAKTIDGQGKLAQECK